MLTKKVIDDVVEFITDPPSWAGDKENKELHTIDIAMALILIELNYQQRSKPDDGGTRALEKIYTECKNVYHDGKARTILR